jgi:hypothetical protein
LLLPTNLLCPKLAFCQWSLETASTAIRLYFTDSDPISIHTLAVAAFSKDLDKRGPKTGTFYDSIENVVKGFEKQAIIAMRDAQNRDRTEFWLFIPAQPNPPRAPALCTDSEEHCRERHIAWNFWRGRWTERKGSY